MLYDITYSDNQTRQAMPWGCENLTTDIIGLFRNGKQNKTKLRQSKYLGHVDF